jgi:hypothetical protein
MFSSKRPIFEATRHCHALHRLSFDCVKDHIMVMNSIGHLGIGAFFLRSANWPIPIVSFETVRCGIENG